MDPPPVSFYYDYVDPASYVLDCVLRAQDLAHGVTLTHRPFELRPSPSPLIDPWGSGWTERWDMVERAATYYGVELARPDLVPWSRKAHELALHAREKGCFERVHTALLRAFFAEGRDIGRVDLLVALAAEAGLDTTETKAVLDVDRFAGNLIAVRDAALRDGVRGVPTLESGELRLQGLPDREGLLRFLDSIRAGPES